MVETIRFASSSPPHNKISIADALKQSSRGDREDRRDRDRGGRDRRRSRSPDYRGPRGSRRDAGGEVDTYSSSRSHRDREREDRYSGRERRDREPWGRERGGGRRDERRDDDDRRGHRDATYDDRPRRRERDRDQERERERRRSASPPPKKREPTPDLTNTTSVLERKRRLTQWDIKPPGYENVTAEQAKLSGMFPLPGAPRQQAMDPTKLQAFMSQPGGTVNSASLKPANSRQAKRLVIRNLPPSATEDSLQAFLNLQLNGLNVIESTDPCISSQFSPDKMWALVEFRSSSDATVALAFDGISMEPDDVADGNGASNGGSGGLMIRRPKDYIVPAIVDDTGYEPGVISSIVVDTPNKISIANIPPYLTDEQVTELLVSFGELKAFILVKDSGTEESRVSRSSLAWYRHKVF